MAGEQSIAAALCKPEGGQTLQVDIAPGGRYALDFDPSVALFEAKDGALSVTFEDGAMLLANFFPSVEKGDILLSLPDGVEVSGRDIVESLNMVLQDFKTQGEDGEKAAADSAPSSVPVDHFEAMIEEGSDIGPACHTVCSLPAASGEAPEHFLHDPHDVPGYFITPHTTAASAGLDMAPHEGTPPGDAAYGGAAGSLPGVAPASDTVEPHAPASSVLFSPQGASGEVLILEDLLDTTLPQTFVSEYASPAFESLLSASHLPDILQGRAVPVNESDCLLPSAVFSDKGDESQDDLLIAFLRMGSL